jgi:hypothetical protein
VGFYYVKPNYPGRSSHVSLPLLPFHFALLAKQVRSVKHTR